MQQYAVPLRYKELAIECAYRCDFVVEDELVVEVKAVEAVHPVHQAQLITYLGLTGINVGLLVNFHARSLKDGIGRLTLKHEPPRPMVDAEP